MAKSIEAKLLKAYSLLQMGILPQQATKMAGITDEEMSDG